MGSSTFWGYVSQSCLSPHVQGGVQLTVCAPTPLPDSCSLHLLFPTDTNDTTDITADTAGTSGVKMVHLVRDEAQLHMYHTTAPGKECADIGTSEGSSASLYNI